MAFGGSKGAAADAAANALASQSPRRAVHYKELTQVAQSMGWVHPGKTNPQIIIYEALLDSVRAGDPRFTFHGKGYYSLADDKIPLESGDLAAPRGASAGRVRKDGEPARSRKKESTLPRVCGNCDSINFNGIKQVTLEGGICMNDDSRRCGVRFESQACERWRERPYGKRQHDAREQARLKGLLEDLGRGSKGKGIKRKAMREAADAVEKG